MSPTLMGQVALFARVCHRGNAKEFRRALIREASQHTHAVGLVLHLPACGLRVPEISLSRRP